MTVPEWEAMTPFQKALIEELQKLRKAITKIDEEAES